jgi:exopolysaccharide biosynthesis polyprenyl glycosylphosphotransferase
VAGIREQQGVRTLSLATDLLLYYGALSVATLARWDLLSQVEYGSLLRDRAVCVLIFLVVTVMLGRLNLARLTDRFDLIYHTFVALALTGVVTLVLVTLLPIDLRMISRRELVLSVPIAIGLLSVWQYASAGMISRFSSLHRHFYVVGDGPEAKRIADEIAGEPSAFSDASCVSFDELKRESERQAGLDTDQSSVKSVIICTGDAQESVLPELLDYCEHRFRDTFLHPTLTSALLLHHGNLMPVAGIPLVRVAGEQSTSPYLYAKRITDVLVALIGLALSLPLCILTAIAIKLTSPGSIFYAQQRLTKGGRPFTIYKFRSMRSDIELKDHTGHVLAQRNDPRITRVGQFIRKHRIDEIPQLFNVLVGVMSLVGPRPVWKEFYDQQRKELPLFDRRLIVRPGLASLSHVLGSYTSTPEDRLRYDLVYINTLSFDVDLRVLLSTVRVVLSGRGSQ